MISHKHKCIFIHIPKCAGTSIEAALGHLDTYTGSGARQDHRAIRLVERPITPRAFVTPDNLRELVRRYRWQYRDTRPENKTAVTAEQFQSYFKWTVVRNPWARAHSWYRNVVRDQNHLNAYNITNDISFADFMQRFAGQGMLKPQSYWLKGFDGEIKMDYVGRFENLAEDYKTAIPHLAGTPPATLPHEIKGGGDDWRAAYDTATQQHVATVYAEDIALFDYSFD